MGNTETTPTFPKRRLEMRCDRCGRRMEEDLKENPIFGSTTIYSCPRCDNVVKEHNGDSLLSSLFHNRNNNIGNGDRRAGPIDLH